MRSIGLAVPKGSGRTSWEEAEALLERVGFPAIIRPSFTLGGTGGGIAYNREEYRSRSCGAGSICRPMHQVLIEQ